VHRAAPGRKDHVKRLVAFVYERFLRYALKFGVIGLIAFFIDLGVFNLLRIGAFGTGHFFQSPVGASIVSVTVATLFTWVGNRYWTFRENRRKNYAMELLEFSAVAVVGLIINSGCLWISHYVMGYTSLLADNISKNVIGLGLATAFRFLAYRYWVYGSHRKDGLSAERDREAEAGALSLFEESSAASRDIATLTSPTEVVPRRVDTERPAS
jgi:putative flippase GtrA